MAEGRGIYLRRILHGAGESRTIAFPDLTRWAECLYRASSTEPPLHGAVFAIEQLELHARALAASHVLGRSHGDDRLLRRLGDSERVIERCHLLHSRAHAAGRRMALAAEWLLDNRWLIEEQVHLARLHFPRGYSRQLPRLAEGGLIRFVDQRALIVDAMAMGILRKYLVENFGLTAARTVLTQFGFAQGWRMAEALQSGFNWPNKADWRRAGSRVNNLAGLFRSEPEIEDPLSRKGVMLLASYEAEQPCCISAAPTAPSVGPSAA